MENEDQQKFLIQESSTSAPYHIHKGFAYTQELQKFVSSLVWNQVC